jgi:hypothetical protein
MENEQKNETEIRTENKNKEKDIMEPYAGLSQATKNILQKGKNNIKKIKSKV